jgi:6-pyruvoyl-tetrahydropterin synthase
MKKIVRLTESDLTRIVNRTINEIFGLSKNERRLKQLTNDVEQAKQEIESLDLSSLFRQTNKNITNEQYEKLIRIIIRNLKDRLPTFLKLFPEILDSLSDRGTNATEAIYDYNGERLYGITLSTLAPFLMRNYGDTLSKERMLKRLNNLLDK